MVHLHRPTQALLVIFCGARHSFADEPEKTPPKGSVKACQDTPGWSNGWSGCAWLSGGQDPALCRPTVNASWPSTSGWTCEYYRQQGLCGKLNGEVKEIRQSARGPFHNWPEKNCCGCEAQDETTCNRQTGKQCTLDFGFCGASQGPAYCHNLSTCLCLPGHCASTDGICSLQTALQVTNTSANAPRTCRDTPDWSNGWSGCAYEEGGRNSAWCKLTPGAAWPSTSGWTCQYYRAQGLCSAGTVASWAKGALHNYPEYNCCGCGALHNTTCNRNTGGSCALGWCDQSRGPTVCLNGRCICQEGHCGTTQGTCSLSVDSYNALTPEALDHATGQATEAGISAAEAAKSAGKNAAGEVEAAALAAGQAALRAGLPLDRAAEAAADAAGEAASEAKATPQQAADAASNWVRKQMAAAGKMQNDQASASAKAAARAASKASSAIFLTKQQGAYAAEAAAVKAALESGLSMQQAESMAAAAVAPSGKTGIKGRDVASSFGPQMIQDAAGPGGNNPLLQIGLNGLYLPLATRTVALSQGYSTSQCSSFSA
ncbi:unnamed protein product [Effrenium voratum]|nr:unnamed protein product [Effrenium voratum]